MTVTDQIKVLDRKIMQNESQYDLDRKAAKIPALSSNNLGKYERLTGEDLGLKPSTIQQTKFEYSPLGIIFNKGLNEDKKEGLFKRLKNIKDKNEKQLKAIEDKNEKQFDKNSKSLKSVSYFSQLSRKAKELFEKIKKEKNDIDFEKLFCVKTDGTIFNFNKFKNSLDLASDIYRNKSLLKNAEDKQNEIKILLNKLRKYSPTNLKKSQRRNIKCCKEVDK